MQPKSCPSIPISIFMAGDIDAARQICREYCDEVGFCVTVTPTHYVYRDGEEAGFIVGLINYPRFPSHQAALAAHALAIADRLRVHLGQESYSIQYPDLTVWHSWRNAA
jgi:ferredoxin